MICSRQQASYRYVSAYALIFGIISVYDRYPWRRLGARRMRGLAYEDSRLIHWWAISAAPVFSEGEAGAAFLKI